MDHIQNSCPVELKVPSQPFHLMLNRSFLTSESEQIDNNKEDAVHKNNKIVYLKTHRYRPLRSRSASLWFDLTLTIENTDEQNKHVPTITSEMIQWTENIKLPLYFHKKITFEFSVRNKFMGSGGMLMGSAVIVNFKNKVFEGKVFDGQREEVGRFQFQFEVISDNKKMSKVEGAENLVVRSILADTRKNTGHKAYLEFYVSEELTYTPELPVHNHEFLAVQTIKIAIPNPRPKQKVHLKLYVDQQPVARCSIPLSDISEGKDKFYSLSMKKMSSQQTYGLIMLKMQKKKQAKTEIATPKNSTKTNKLPKLTTKSTLFKSNSSTLLNSKRKESPKNMGDSLVKKLTKKYLHSSELKLFSIGQNENKDIRGRKHSTPLSPVMVMSQHH